MRSVARDGQTWRLAGSAEVAWINDGTAIGMTISAAVPEVFAVYATLVLPADRDRQERHDQAVLALLRRNTQEQPWWLGFLDTGSDDVVFPDAPRVTMYPGWRYVLVEAGPEQAATWRRPRDEIRPTSAGSTVTATGPTGTGQASRARAFSKGALPDLMFPADRSWLLSTMWDDDWSCLGGPARLIADVLSHPDLEARQVSPGQDATPPGHTAY